MIAFVGMSYSVVKEGCNFAMIDAALIGLRWQWSLNQLLDHGAAMSDGAEIVCKCKECGHLMNDVVGEGAQRIPCPNCGSKSRAVSVTVTETVKLSAGYRVQGYSETRRPKKPGKSRKPFIDDKSMDEVYRVDGQTYRVERTLDHENDSYKEKITNPRTGEVVKHVEEKLSEHHGHGSAKKK